MASASLGTLGLLALLAPAVALAHGAGSHDPDPSLHVDASLKDCSVAFAPELSQGAYRRFVREFGSVSAFKQGGPPRTLGRLGVALDVEQIWFSVAQHSAAWNDTFAHPDAYHELGSNLAFPKLRLRVGVTDDLDVGAFYTQALRANYGWFGVEATYGLLRQRPDQPVALSIRAAYTKTLYVTDMNMHALTADVTAGHTFWKLLTPYVGVGADAVYARETSPAVDLHDESALVPHATGGVELRFWHVAVGAEAQVGALVSYQAQLSAVF